jgi:peptidoglycan hydrolase CwlO-like protein
MKEKIINVLVVVGMIVVANYPLYNSLKSTAEHVDGMISSMREEVAMWKKEIESTQEKVENVRIEIVSSIDKGLAQTNNVLNKIDEIDSDINNIIGKIDSIKFDASDKINSIKEKPMNSVKDLFKIK